MVKKLLSLYTLCLIFSATAFAQSGTITGTVTDQSSGETLPSVNVYVVELQRGAATNAQGEFTIEGVDYGTYTVRASFVGYNTFEQEVTVDQSTVTLDIALTSSTQQLEDVVVTAYGVEQSMNDLPYSAQKVDGDIVAENRSDNFAASLSGRVAGLKVSQSNGMGGSTNIVMRGYKSISGNNQVLFVVDGVPYANQEFNDASTEAGFAGYDYGNTGVDVNPDNIASVNVLKGPAAAALYGSRASNGAIVIETKGGKSGSRPVQVTFNSSATIQKINKNTFIDNQELYGGGYVPSFGTIDINGDGTDEVIGNPWDDGSYGPKFEGQEVYQWDAFVEGGPNFMTPTPWVAPNNRPVDFFETGTDFTNSIQIDGGFEGGYYNMGYNQTNTTGIVPNAKLDKNKLNFSAGYDVSDKLSVSGKIQYSQTSGHARPARGYSTMMSLYRQWWNTSVDLEAQKSAYFRNRTNETWNWSQGDLGGSPIYWNNPYWDRYENFSTDERDRYFGNVEANYQVMDWLSLTGRISIDSYTQLIEERNNVGSIGHGSDYAGYHRRAQEFSEFNYDLLANYQKQLNEDVRVSGVVGMNLRRNHSIGITAETNGGLLVPGIYSLNNSASPIQFPNETDEELAVDGYFASFNLNYGGFFNLEATGRRDESSSLPDGENVYYYPSVSAGFTFSEFVDAEWLSFGKIRGSWAEVGNTAPPHSLKDNYDRPSNFGSTGLYTIPSTKNNPNLKPERTKSWEVGVQLGVFNDRATLDVNYYDQNTTDQILATEVSRSTGYSTKFVNAGSVVNRGWEVSSTLRPVTNRDFTWTMNVNWSKNINEVKELAPGVTNYQLASPQGGVTISAALGEAYGAIRGTDFVNLDGEPWSTNGGKRLIDEDGYYVMTSSSNNIIGDMNPDWTGGISNRLNYKSWSLNVLVDVRWGGDIFSLDQYYGRGTGLYPITAENNSMGNPKRDPVSEGGGVILDGYNADGSKNDIAAFAGAYYGAYYWGNNPAAQYIYDGSYVKLREVGLTYNLPQNLLDKVGPIKGASVSAIGRNLWIIHKNLPHADPEQGIVAGNVQGYQGGAYPSTRNFTFNLKLEF